MKLKRNFSKGLGFGVGSNQENLRYGDQSNRYFLKHIQCNKLHLVYSINTFLIEIMFKHTYHIHITKPFRSRKKAFPF